MQSFEGGYAPYVQSVLVERMRATMHDTILDLDGTDDGTEGEREAVDCLAREQGSLIYGSARTEELMMSDEEYALSVERYGFTRPRSLKSVSAYYQNQTDPHAMCPFGGIPHLLQKNGGFDADDEYAELAGMKDWYKDTRLALARLDNDLKIQNALASIEDAENYRAGTADVMPLPYRIQLDFRGRDAELQMLEVRNRITSSMVLVGLPRNVRFVDESNPAHERCTLYLAPRFAPKGRSVSFLLRKAAKVADVPLASRSIDMAGDTFTDLSMLGALPEASDVRFLLAGGSRLAPHFTPGHERYGTPFAGKPTKGLCARLQPLGPPGIYSLRLPGAYAPRTFVNGDEAYPGLVGAASVKQFLSERAS